MFFRIVSEFSVSAIKEDFHHLCFLKQTKKKKSIHMTKETLFSALPDSYCFNCAIEIKEKYNLNEGRK